MFIVYCISNSISGRIYIGSSAQARGKRWAQHKCTLRAQRHANPHLQRSWNKYGGDAFTFSVVSKHATIEEMELAESAAINSYPKQKTYNIRADARSNRGHKHTEETKARIRAALKGRDTLTPEARKAAAEKLRGQTKSPHVIAALAEGRWRLFAERGSEMRRKCRKLSDEQVREVRLQIGEGRDYSQISSEFGVSRSTVTLIKKGRRYADVKD